VGLGDILGFVLHINDHLLALSRDHGPWIYAIIFGIVFCETGLVVTPFLPGDSLLFAVGAMCGMGAGEGGLSLWIVIPLLIAAAVIGDAVNYRIGYALGPGFLERKLGGAAHGTGLLRFVKREHLEKTQRFYEKYGGKAIILARFVPIVRTFAPFVAGIGKMRYRDFLLYNVIGAVAWVLICVLGGFFFGGLEVVKKNFELVVVAIVIVSVIPIGVEMFRGWLAKRRVPIKALPDSSPQVARSAGAARARVAASDRRRGASRARRRRSRPRSRARSRGCVSSRSADPNAPRRSRGDP
jgi:membrane-associated protein